LVSEPFYLRQQTKTPSSLVVKDKLLYIMQKKRICTQQQGQ